MSITTKSKTAPKNALFQSGNSFGSFESSPEDRGNTAQDRWIPHFSVLGRYSDYRFIIGSELGIFSAGTGPWSSYQSCPSGVIWS